MIALFVLSWIILGMLGAFNVCRAEIREGVYYDRQKALCLIIGFGATTGYLLFVFSLCIAFTEYFPRSFLEWLKQETKLGVK